MLANKKYSINFKKKFDRIKKFVKANQNLKPVLAALLLIVICIIIFICLKICGASTKYYSVTYGILGGLFGGYLIQTRINHSLKFGAIGMFSGMGADLLAIKMSDANQKNAVYAINSISAFIGKTFAPLLVNSNHTNRQAQIQLLANDLETGLTLGLWVFALVIAIVLIFSGIFKENVEP